METMEVLVAFSDLTGYAKLAAKMPDAKVFAFLAEYYEFIGDVVSPAGGEVIKFMGDGALLMFREERADAGVRALLDLQARGDRFLSVRGFSCRLQIRAHFGSVQRGALGTKSEKRIDVIGSTVNTMFLLRRADFSITPEAFRQLKPETRKFFQKHTPPVSYIPVGHPRPHE